MRSFRNPWRSFWACLPSAFALAAPALAGEYSLRLGVDQYFEYTDNVDFTQDDEIDATSYTLAPGIGLDGRGERWQLGLDLRTPFQRFSESRLNSDNQDFGAEYLRTLQKGSLGFDARILRNSTHNIDEAGFTDRTANRRVMESLSAYWARRVGERNEIKLTGSGQKVKYDSTLTCPPDATSVEDCTGSPQLNDYDYGSVQVDWTRLMTERTSTVLSTSWTRFRAGLPPTLEFGPPLDPPDRTSETWGMQGGLTRVFSEKLNGRFMLGARHAENEISLWDQECLLPFGDFCLIPAGPPFLTEQTTTDTTGLALMGVNYRGDRLELDVSLSQSLIPSGRAGLMSSRELATDLSWQLREHLYLRVSASVLHNESDETLPTEDPASFVVSKIDNKYYQLRPRVHWRFKEHWALDAGVDYRSHDVLSFFSDDTTLPPALPPSIDATAQSVFLTLIYNAEPIPVFR